MHIAIYKFFTNLKQIFLQIFTNFNLQTLKMKYFYIFIVLLITVGQIIIDNFDFFEEYFLKTLSKYLYYFIIIFHILFVIFDIIFWIFYIKYYSEQLIY